MLHELGSPVVPVCPFWFGVSSLLKPNSRKKVTLIIKRLLENLVRLCMALQRLYGDCLKRFKPTLFYGLWIF